MCLPDEVGRCMKSSECPNGQNCCAEKDSYFSPSYGGGTCKIDCGADGCNRGEAVKPYSDGKCIDEMACRQSSECTFGTASNCCGNLTGDLQTARCTTKWSCSGCVPGEADTDASSYFDCEPSTAQVRLSLVIALFF